MAIGTYTADLKNSQKDYVRFLVGDTSEPFILSDVEINSLLEMMAVNKVASRCARTMSAYYSRIAEQQTGKVKISFAKTAAHLLTLASELEQDTTDSLPYWYAGGQSFEEKTTDREDPDLVQPAFRRDDGFEGDDAPGFSGSNTERKRR